MQLSDFLNLKKVSRDGNPPLEGREAVPKRYAVGGSDLQPRPTGVSRAGLMTMAAVLARIKKTRKKRMLIYTEPHAAIMYQHSSTAKHILIIG